MAYKEETEEQKRSARRMLLVLLIVLGLCILILIGQAMGLIKVN